MTDTAQIKAAMTRLEKVLSVRPSEGKSTKSVVAKWTKGMECSVTDGEFTVVSDHPPAVWAGENSGPTPGFFARAGLAACLAQGYALIFAHRDIQFDKMTVEVESDANIASFFRIGDIESGFQELRYVVHVDSQADPATVEEAIKASDAGSPVLNSFLKPVTINRDVRINHQQDAAE
jgi:uncharacterized OsmC-like protein